MPDVLSQSEVDVLLAAVNGDKGETRPPVEGRGLGEVRYYDFLRPERASLAAMRALTDVHEAAARGIAAAFSGALRTQVDCRLQAFDQVAWGEFVMDLPNPTCFALIAASPEHPQPTFRGGRFAFEIGPEILYPMMERLLGAQAGDEGEVPGRPLTAVEQRVAATLMEMALRPIADAWGRARPIELALVRIEPNPQIAHVAPPGEMAARATFEVSIGSRSGLAHLAMPFGTFSGILAELAAASGRLDVGPGEDGAGTSGPLSGVPTHRVSPAASAALGRVPVRLEAVVASLQMTLRKVAQLSAGDEIDTGRSESDGIDLTVAGRPKFRATMGEFRGRRAARISRSPGGAKADLGGKGSGT